MKVEINLLEQKEKQNVVPYLLGLVALLALLLIWLLLYMDKQAALDEVEDVNSQIQQVRVQQQEYQEALKDEVQTNRRELKRSVEALESNLFPAVSLLERMVSLLPERGFFERYVYVRPQSLLLYVRFDDFQDVAAYTNRLIDEDYVSDVSVQQITSNVLEEDLDPTQYRPRYVAEYEVTLDKDLWEEGDREDED
ncbi:MULTISPECIES: hypothetical protein [Pontibacillus]|uniref:Type IV pilus assembly protein PilN n=1 Tax=Pontibacillus chungwhensis TaxID=265426 RepID=A0ABY8UTW5_9BACI|nr:MULTISPECIES: hypothetical protein [Pontibacillus]MCD5323731.1 hypothetical protein [Pontibacillus sp. HN14]WIF97097.1 hypothetical protein QNI29_15295 [Pontibacillus chungwhensis]